MCLVRALFTPQQFHLLISMWEFKFLLSFIVNNDTFTAADASTIHLRGGNVKTSKQTFSVQMRSDGNQRALINLPRACLRRSTDLWPPGCWLVGPDGSCCSRKLGRPINSEKSLKVSIRALMTLLLISFSLFLFHCVCVCVCFCTSRKRIGVFCCGPKAISRTLHRLCNSFQSSETVFEFNKESFSWSELLFLVCCFLPALVHD